MTKDIVVVGTSAGGIEALKVLVSGLPKGFAGTLFVVMHTSPHSPGILDAILQQSGPLSAIAPGDGERFRSGRIYVAPPDHHLLIEPGVVRLTRGPKENRFRPAIDPLFRSAAQVYGPRVVGVILTGGLDDGTAGLWAIKKLGGTAVVQDPEEALYPSMPRNALNHINVDYCLKLKEIAPLLVRLATEPAKEKGEFPVPEDMDIEINIAKARTAHDAGIFKLGEPSNFSCPECHGVLLQLNDGSRRRYRCHTGHAYSADSLLSDLTERVGETLWSAIRSIEESAMLMRHLGQHLNEIEKGVSAEVFFQKANEAQRRADKVRQAVMDHEELSTERVISEPES